MASDRKAPANISMVFGEQESDLDVFEPGSFKNFAYDSSIRGLRTLAERGLIKVKLRY